MKILLFAASLFLVPSLFAQPTFERFYGNSLYMQDCNAVLVTSDSSYIMTGKSHIRLPPCPNGCFGSAYLMKVDQLGDTVFAKSFEETSRGYTLIPTMEGGYAVGAVKEDEGNYLIITNAAGDTLWTRIFVSGGNLIAQSPDSCFFMAGPSLLKVSVTGDSLWTKPLGTALSLFVTSIIVSSDSGLYVSAYSSTNSLAVLIKLNSVGDTLWSKTFGKATSRKVKELPDHQLIYLSETWDTTAWEMVIGLLKLNSNGDTVWARKISGVNSVEAGDVVQCSDSGYMISGWTYNFQSNEGDLLLVKTDSLGFTEWTRTYSHNYNDMGYSVHQTYDGGFVVAGITNNVVTSWESQIYLVKTDNMGNVLQVSYPEVYDTKNNLVIFPNPGSGKFRLEFNHPEPNVDLQIYNSMGELISNKTESANHEIQIDLTNYPAGIYFVQVVSGPNIFKRKIIKI